MNSEGRPPQFLHNMSAPPKTTIRWGGLGVPGGFDDGRIRACDVGRQPFLLGTPVGFAFPREIARKSPTALLRLLGHERDADPAARLRALIDDHAATLPLPDGCVVVAWKSEHRTPWTDTLSVLAVLTKSSGAVWLRAKMPSLAALHERTALSLLIPPSFATRIPGASP